jgi:hypothetical protein
MVNDRCLLTELDDGSGVVLHLDTKFYYTLNASGVVVWKGIKAGARDRAGAAKLLEREFEVDEATAQRDLATVLDYMLAEGLLIQG